MRTVGLCLCSCQPLGPKSKGEADTRVGGWNNPVKKNKTKQVKFYKLVLRRKLRYCKRRRVTVSILSKIKDGCWDSCLQGGTYFSVCTLFCHCPTTGTTHTESGFGFKYIKITVFILFYLFISGKKKKKKKERGSAKSGSL